MRRCFEMHILPKRWSLETASWPGPQAGGLVISLVLREMQGPARDAWTLVRSSGRRRGDHVTRGRGPNGLFSKKETILSRRRVVLK